MSTAVGPRGPSALRLVLLSGALFACFWLTGCGGGQDPRHTATPSKVANADGVSLGSDWGGDEEPAPAKARYKDKASVEVKDKDKDKTTERYADKDKSSAASDFAPASPPRGFNPTVSLPSVEATTSLESAIGPAASTDPPKPETTPQVWHRDAARPPLARVYVGDGNSLELVSLHVTVTVEGPRARTVVDHVFRNPHDRRLEGTFEYPLPAGASPSYFAMFLGGARDAAPPRFTPKGDAAPLSQGAFARMQPDEMVRYVNNADWGPLQQGRIVANDKATETYEEIVRGRIDPALLEYAGGNTFRGRVFPIAPKGYNRVILAYEELLPVIGDRMMYRFPLPGGGAKEMAFTLQAAAAECTRPEFTPADSVKQEGGGRLLFSRTWDGPTPDGEITFACTPAAPRVQAVSGRQGDNGPYYLHARLRPELPKVEKAVPFADHAVFLLDTSLSEHPDRFAVSMKLLRKVLETDPDIRQFNVLTFNVGAAWVEPTGWLPNTAAGRETALSRLDGLVLEGATDLSCALDRLAAPGFAVAPGTPLNCFLLSDGAITWGESDAAALAARFNRRCPFPTRFHCYRTGLGAENAELFDALTRAGGGVYDCYGEAGVTAAAAAHRNQCLEVEKIRIVGGATSDVLVAGRRAAVYPDGELVVAARANAPGRLKIVVEGRFMGQPVTQEFPVEVGDGGELAPRAWGELAVAGLLAVNDAQLDSLATAYCQQFGIVSRVASFLVLENDNDYKRLNLEEERGRTLAGDLGQFLEAQWQALGQAGSPRQAFQRFLKRVDARTHLEGGPVWKLLAMLDDADFDLPAGGVGGAVLHTKDVPADYLQAREKDREAVAPYLTEMKRRAAAGDVDGAVRVLSSVIEEHPARGDALRLVGYRLLDLKQPAQGARLFGEVQKQRPFEPHSYRDLARSLEDCGKYGLAAAQYEVVLAGTWHNRFGPALKQVAQEEYVRMMHDALRRQAVGKDLADYFAERLSRLSGPQSQADLRVTISWNTDGTDVDLWVIEPDGTKVYYGHRQSGFGGELSPDEMQGYGPERYQIAHAQPGVYTILVHYFRPNPNLLGGETHVNVVAARKDGGPDETVERHTVVLKNHDQQVEVCKVKF